MSGARLPGSFRSASEERFKAAVRKVIANGEYPGPKAILHQLGKTGNNLSSKQVEWREQVLLVLGWTHRGEREGMRRGVPGAKQRQWVPPSTWLETPKQNERST